ncbi:MAG: glycosyltransferase [bacterium]|uniref:Glycosyltransferase n=1 Tax=Candidatus Methylomirabilis tolerans TaxID=3123416 RepID=A0AAJ1AI45_9BACT|nr:glycosyltransferase [Candidatus Methylomirabilis sp.]
MRVIHVVPAITEEASGPSYSVVRLCYSLIEAGEDLTLAAMDWSPLPSVPAFMKVFPIGVGPRRLGRSPGMSRWLMDETTAGRVSVLHSHGMWQMNAVYPGWAVKGRKTKLVVSPRGAFSTWAMNHGSPFKRVMWPLIQRPAVEQAACFHATAESEYEDIRRLRFKQPVAIIPNGIDVPEFAQKIARDFRTLLFLGRIHPVKGVDVLLNAWAAVTDRFPNWQLLVVGTDTGYGVQGGYLEQMNALAAKLKLKRLEFVGPLYGETKWSTYREADLFVLPTHSENFGITVAEALAAGTPAIVTKGAPWQGLQTYHAGWWIDIGVDPLVASLEEAMAESPDELARRGIRGREWMVREFSWHHLGKKMDQTYQWLVEGGEHPAWVRMN